MARKLTSTVRAEQRRQRVARMYLRGFSLGAIAEAVEINIKTVSHDLAKVRSAWRQEATLSIQRRIDKEIAKIDMIETEAWEAWEASKAEEVTEATELSQPEGVGAEAKPGSRKTSRRKSNRIPHAPFLDRIAWCVEQRLKLVGAYPGRGSSAGDAGPGPGAVLVVDRERATLAIRDADEAQLAALGQFYGRLGVTPAQEGQPMVIDAEASADADGSV